MRKLILSQPEDKRVKRTVGKLFSGKGGVYLQLESFTSDGKALHRNIEMADAAAVVADELERSYRQLNVIAESGELWAKRSSKEKLFISDKIKRSSEQKSEIHAHDKERNYILRDGEPCEFLTLLKISDANGRVYDRKRSKFRQINRFLDYVADVYELLPAEGELYILDLCCGKSYLTFAVYHYLTEIRGRRVKMCGVDLKSDVVALCGGYAERLGYSGLSFVCGDINDFEPEREPDMVISLHACDIATDITLAKAVKSGAKLIFTTPCCHHEMMGQMNGGSEVEDKLDAVTDYPLLKQKLCDALTDGMRCERLYAEGYKVSVTELIDPDETPKNLMIRAIFSGHRSDEEYRELLAKYDKRCEYAGVHPYLDKLLERR